MAYKNPKDLAAELANPLKALDMAEKAKDVARVLEKGMNIHLMGPEGRITIRHTPEALQEAHAARQAMQAGVTGVQDVQTHTAAHVRDERSTAATQIS